MLRVGVLCDDERPKGPLPWPRALFSLSKFKKVLGSEERACLSPDCCEKDSVVEEWEKRSADLVGGSDILGLVTWKLQCFLLMVVLVGLEDLGVMLPARLGEG